MEKNFLEIFSKYLPPEEYVDILLSASSIRTRVSKEKRIIEIEAHFPRIIPKKTLYNIQAGLCKAYSLNFAKILPKYPAELFNYDYVPEILCETEEVGIVARGFFSDYDYKLDLENKYLEIEIPFGIGGITLLEDASTPRVIEAIINSEFSIQVHVTISHKEFGGGGYNDFQKQRLEEIDKLIQRAEREYSASSHADGGAAESDKPKLPRLRNILSDDAQVEWVDDTHCKIGVNTYDIGEPNFCLGNEFDIKPVTISSLSRSVGNVVVIGTVFSFKSELTRKGDKYNVSFGIFDGCASMYVKNFSLSLDQNLEISEIIKVGTSIAVFGYTKFEKNETDLYINYQNIAIISKIERVDNAPKKRVELHLHTAMSTMDALIPPDVAVKTAKKWGHPAVAITDHGNLQGFPDAMLTAEKCGMKVIYGLESYFVNDTSSAIYGEYNGDFDNEFIVFDIETTGLSQENCKITEIGAVKIKCGKVIDRFSVFVNPELPIPEDIVKLTGITDEMVADAEKIDTVLPKFLDFIGDRLLIAHNALFDTGFIRAAAKSLGLPFENSFLDTVALSRYLNPSLKSHKLDALAKFYELGDFNHHRACDDAEMLSLIFFKMTEALSNLDINNFSMLKTEMSAKTNPIALKPYHQIILVKNAVGLKNLYKLVSKSFLEYYGSVGRAKKVPRIPKTELEKHREGLIIGSACEAGELFTAILENRPDKDIENIVSFYDYLEIQPICNNRFLVNEGKVANDDGLRDLNRRIVALGEKYKKPVVATCDAHFLNKEDEINRKIILSSMKFSDADRDINLYYRTTEEMLEEFAYLGEEKAYEVVVTNTNLIADMIDYVRPIPKGAFTPKMDGAEEDLQKLCWDKAHSMYGDDLPEIVEKRLEKELTSIIKNGFAVLYMIAQKLVWYSEKQGYLVGSRGSVGSSFVATMAGISEVNPLPAHYYCPNCRYSDFETGKAYGSGFDMPDKTCPVCGTKLNADGHNIPFETFLGFYGDKSPDIDLNFSGDVQGRVHKYTEELFGSENVFRAGTIGTLADKTAYGSILNYFEQKGVSISESEMERLMITCLGVKKNTGQHPGGIIVIPREYDVYDFTPVQYPAEDPTKNVFTTHFAFSYLHDTILKLDELGHEIPTKYKYLETFTNTSVLDVPMNNKAVYDLFVSTKPLQVSPEDIDCNTGTYGLPEFGTNFVIKMLEEARPQTFADLLQISGLSHGTDVWTGNAQELIKNGTCDISKVIGCRDNIMNDLIRYGLENATSFKIMESVRKGRGLNPDWEALMREKNVPEWYIDSCKKIKYMFPKAHAAAYVMSAIRLGWYKVHKPIAYYCAMFTVASDDFDAELVSGGRPKVVAYIKDIEKKIKDRTVTQKEKNSLSVIKLINEAMSRGIKFLPIDLERSDSFKFIPEEKGIRMPFSSLNGLGDSAAENIIKAREEEPIFSVEDLQKRAGLSKKVIEVLRKMGVLDSLSETDQLSFF
ncbi:MAG: PolC-type DNA polymerase III [Clostridia bacterium]|nr:PolC-type DNA polymerase III [Clostridia bacterium]